MILSLAHLATKPSPHFIVSARLFPLLICANFVSGPGLSPDNPMAIVQKPIFQVESASSASPDIAPVSEKNIKSRPDGRGQLVSSIEDIMEFTPYDECRSST